MQPRHKSRFSFQRELGLIFPSLDPAKRAHRRMQSLVALGWAPPVAREAPVRTVAATVRKVARYEQRVLTIGFGSAAMITILALTAVSAVGVWAAHRLPSPWLPDYVSIILAIASYVVAAVLDFVVLKYWRRQAPRLSVAYAFRGGLATILLVAWVMLANNGGAASVARSLFAVVAISGAASLLIFAVPNVAPLIAIAVWNRRLLRETVVVRTLDVIGALATVQTIRRASRAWMQEQLDDLEWIANAIQTNWPAQLRYSDRRTSQLVRSHATAAAAHIRSLKLRLAMADTDDMYFISASLCRLLLIATYQQWGLMDLADSTEPRWSWGKVGRALLLSASALLPTIAVIALQRTPWVQPAAIFTALLPFCLWWTLLSVSILIYGRKLNPQTFPSPPGL